MSPGRLSVAGRLVVVALGPGVVLAAFAAAWLTGLAGPPRPAELEARADRIGSWLDRELEGALALADAERDSRPLGGTQRVAIADRLEGVGILDADRNYLEWSGTPPEPEMIGPAEVRPRFRVERSGVHTRLLVETAPAPDGRSALASFIVDSRVEELSASHWMPARLLGGLDLELRFGTRAAAAPDGGQHVEWRAPDGSPFVDAVLRPASREHAARRIASRAWAWAAAVASILLLAFVPWNRDTGSHRLDAALAIVLARAVLLLARAPAWILPAELGTAMRFGSSAAWGLLASPADLALTTLAAYGLLRLLPIGPGGASEHGPRRIAPAVLATAAAGAFVLWLLSAIARGSSAPLLGEPTLWRSPASVVVAGSLVVALLALADGIDRWLDAPSRAAERPAPRVGPAVVLFLLVLATSFWLTHLDARSARERLRSEFAPLVIDPGPGRSLALSSTMSRAREHLLADPDLLRGPDVHRLAYDLWIDSELYFDGQRSSLDIYDGDGTLVSHFGFDLPLLTESEPPPQVAGEPVRIRENETFRPVAALRQRLLHGDARLGPTGEDGWIVGHVLDEPTNLAFLPSSRAYLAALGTGAPFSGRRTAEDLEYVLYDASGTVVLSTLLRPPAMADVLVQALERDGRIVFGEGDERWAGLALQDAENRLHALVVPSPGPLARLAAAVRLALLALAIFAARATLRLAESGGGVPGLLDTVRGSFHRKLLVALVVASTVPLLGLALLIQGSIVARGRAALVDSATQYARAAQRVLDDYVAVERERGASAEPVLNDEIVYWLRNINGQEIHVFENGLLRATSRRELFASGALPPRLDGAVHDRLGRDGSPYVVVPAPLGPRTVPVAYAPVEQPDPQRALVAAVPVVTEERVIARSVERVGDTILLATVVLAGLLAVVAAYVARTVARPVRELVSATARIAQGDYGARLRARTSDEVADLVRGFNSMAASLSTQRDDLERRREYTERLLEHATTGVISLDPGGAIVTLNPAARRLFGGTPARPRVGEALERALGSGSGLEPLRRVFERPTAPDGAPVEVDIGDRGAPRRLRVVRVPLADPAAGSIGTLVLLDDVTDLMRSNQLAAWAEMARAIAHEIKNPLTPIQLSTEHLDRLLRDRGVLPSPDVEACIETIKKQVRALYDIAGEFSAYAKLPALDPRPADPVEFLREVAAPYRSATLRGVEVVERHDPTGRAAIDRRVLGRAMVNLIENALQAMPDGGTLTLSVGSDPDSGGVAFAVSDTGSGITPEVRRRLFEPYFSTKSSGTGLGLAIVRRAVEAHGGTVEVEGEPGRGTTFRIRLPAIPGP